jgi:hypothetical protein
MAAVCTKTDKWIFVKRRNKQSKNRQLPVSAFSFDVVLVTEPQSFWRQSVLQKKANLS